MKNQVLSPSANPRINTHRGNYCAKPRSTREMGLLSLSFVLMKVLFLTTATILSLSIVRLPLAISGPIESTPAASAPGAAVGSADTYFVTQTSLGTAFEIDSGRVAETKGTTQAIRSYAQQTLPKMQDHLERALKLQGGAEEPEHLLPSDGGSVRRIPAWDSNRITHGNRTTSEKDR